MNAVMEIERTTVDDGAPQFTTADDRKTIIEMERITKTYQMGSQVVHALRGVNLDIKQGEFVAIMGPSGSGKSTLMNMIGCLDVPTDGSYVLNGTDVSTMTDDDQARIRNQQIGFVFQHFNLLARTSALKQVSLPLMYSGISQSERGKIAQKALDQVGLGDRVHHRPDELSGGQQQRVAIARAIATSPSIILADEPTGALDTQTGEDILKLFKDLNAGGMTIVMITHDPEVGEKADRVIWIRDGLIQ